MVMPMLNDNDDTSNDLELDVSLLAPEIGDAVEIMNITAAPRLCDVIARGDILGTYDISIHTKHVRIRDDYERCIGLIIDELSSATSMQLFVVMIGDERYVISSCWLEVISRS